MSRRGPRVVIAADSAWRGSVGTTRSVTGASAVGSVLRWIGSQPDSVGKKYVGWKLTTVAAVTSPAYFT